MQIAVGLVCNNVCGPIEHRQQNNANGPRRVAVAVGGFLGGVVVDSHLHGVGFTVHTCRPSGRQFRVCVVCAWLRCYRPWYYGGAFRPRRLWHSARGTGSGSADDGVW